MPSDVTEGKIARFSQSLTRLNDAPTYAKSRYQTDVYQEANRLLDTEEGLEVLFQYADQFDEAGVFQDGPWEDASKLQPPLVAGSLQAKGLPYVIEMLSNLRMLAIAEGKAQHLTVSKEMGMDFLNEVMALNLDLLFPQATEASRIEKKENVVEAQRLFEFISRYLHQVLFLKPLSMRSSV